MGFIHGRFESGLRLSLAGLFEVVLDVHLGGFDGGGDPLRLLLDVLAHPHDFRLLFLDLAQNAVAGAEAGVF
jgi:hypothetical protein